MRRSVITVREGTEITNTASGRSTTAEFDHTFLAVPNGPEQYLFRVGAGRYSVPSDVVDCREVEVEAIALTMLVDDRGRVLEVSTASTRSYPREGLDGDIFWPVAEVGSHAIGVMVREKG